MTVQELIDELNQVEDKSKTIVMTVVRKDNTMYSATGDAHRVFESKHDPLVHILER